MAMHPMDELRNYIGFTDEDSALLRRLWPALEPEAAGITDRFYAATLRFEGARAVFADLAQVERLKKTLVRWMGELCAGPHDIAYYDLRQRIGRMHVKIKLPQQYMFTAMSLLRDDLVRIARRAFPAEKEAMIAAVIRITDIELAIMLGTYMETRAEADLAGLRELIISHLPMTVLVLDKHGRVSSATGAPSRALADPGGDLVGRSWREVVVPALANAARLEERLARAGETGREIVLPRVDVDVDGTPLALRVTIAHLEHSAAATMLHFEDLTDAVASEARAKRAEHLAKLGTLAATVAHEIRNPLAGISGTVQVVQSTLPPDDKRAVALQKVQEQISRLGGLVGDLLSFSRPVQVTLRTVDLAMVAQAATSHEPEGVTIEGGGRAHADGALLTQVLLNLVQNATQAGARQVRVLVDDVRLQVIDDGPGIPDELKEKIFEPFFTTKTRGTGLGLPIARKMVEGMGGTLQLVKSPGPGAMIEISLRPAED
jgi:signal transduction histidine kinase